MKKCRRNFVILLIVLILIVVIIGSYIYYMSLESVTISSGIYMYDTSTPERAVGISDYVFVAKIDGIVRTEYRNPTTVEIGLLNSKTSTTPYTVYNIEVVKNIKGELITSEPIEYMQYGGINKDRKSYTFMEETGLLEIGKYYILMVDTFEKDGGIIEVTEPNRRILLDDVENIEDIEKSELVKRYEKAYKNEVIPDGFENENRYISRYDVNYET